MNSAETGRGGVSSDESEYIERGLKMSREEILADFANNFYGVIPKDRPDIGVDVLDEAPVYDSKTGKITAIRKQIALSLSREGQTLKFSVLIYTPPGKGPFPAILSLNMYGNHSLTTDPCVVRDEVYLRGFSGVRIPFNEKHRGSKEDRLPIGKMVEDGNAVVTAYYWPITPDYRGGLGEGIYKLYPDISKAERGAISGWAGGMAHVLSYLEEEPLIDHTKIVFLGFSRIGKTVQWAAANDSRVAGVVSLSSGKGGAASLETQSGEPDWNLDFNYRHWFKDAYSKAKRRLLSLRRDSYMLLSLLPRALIATAKEDVWSAHNSQKEEVEKANEIRSNNGDIPIQFLSYSHRKDFGHGIAPHVWSHVTRLTDSVTKTLH